MLGNDLWSRFQASKPVEVINEFGEIQGYLSEQDCDAFGLEIFDHTPAVRLNDDDYVGNQALLAKDMGCFNRGPDLSIIQQLLIISLKVRESRLRQTREEQQFLQNLWITNPVMHEKYTHAKQEKERAAVEAVQWRHPQTIDEAMGIIGEFTRREEPPGRSTIREDEPEEPLFESVFSEEDLKMMGD